MNTNAKLTDEQRRKIEENRRKALEKRAARLQNQGSSSSNSAAAKNLPVPQQQARSFPHKPVSQAVRSECAHPCQTSSNLQSGSNDKNMKEFLSKFSRPQNKLSYKSKEPGSDKSSSNYKNQQNIPQKNQQYEPSSSGPPNYGGYNTELSKGGVTKVVKGTCVLLNQTRFAVKVKFHGPLIGIFKTIPSRSYGMCKWLLKNLH